MPCKDCGELTLFELCDVCWALARREIFRKHIPALVEREAEWTWHDG